MRAGLGPEPLDDRAVADPLDRPVARPTRRGAAPRGSRRRRPGPGRARATATLPASSWRLAITRLSVMIASGTSPPHMPEWTAWPRVRTSMSARTRPRSDVVSAGSPMSQLPESAITITSARELVVVLLEQRGQRVGADLLLALDEHHDVDRQVVAVRPDRTEVRRDAGLVVGGAAAVEPAAALGRLERRASPSRRGRSRAVRRGARRAAPSAHPPGPALCAITAGRAAVGADDVDVCEPLGPEQVGHRVGRAPHLAGAGRVGAHRLDPDQVLEVGAEGGHQVAHRCAEVVGHAPTLGRSGLAEDHGLVGAPARGRSAPGRASSA